MKNKKWAIVSFAVLIVSLTSCGSQPVGGRSPASVREPAIGPVAFSAPDELDYAIRDISDYLNDNIPAGSRIVILNIESASEPLSDYILDELIANAVNDRNFEVIDRHQLDIIRAEQGLQLSGEVDDNTALSVGRFLGAQTIVSGRIMPVGNRFRITIRALDVETARVQGQYNRNLAAGPTINTLMAAAGARPQAAPAPAAVGGRQVAAAGTVQAAPAVVEPPITGTMVPGDSFAEMMAWLQRSAQSHGTYIVELSADEIIAPNTNLDFPGAINITIVLRGDEENRTLRLSAHGTMFTVSPNVTFILDNNITLHGHAGNTSPLVSVNGGTLRMRTGSTITGNTNTFWGYGGGVSMRGNSTFEMTGGAITNNTSRRGGGILAYGTFIMSDGVISGNNSSYGGGVYAFRGSFTMTGGTISNNTASLGGGVGAGRGGANFIMRGGTIAGNTAREIGGGVGFTETTVSTFTKTGGTITSHINDPNNGNVVADEGGNVWARRGHAVFFSNDRRRETTAGPGVNVVSCWSTRRNEGWES